MVTWKMSHSTDISFRNLEKLFKLLRSSISLSVKKKKSILLKALLKLDWSIRTLTWGPSKSIAQVRLVSQDFNFNLGGGYLFVVSCTFPTRCFWSFQVLSDIHAFVLGIPSAWKRSPLPSPSQFPLVPEWPLLPAASQMASGTVSFWLYFGLLSYSL